MQLQDVTESDVLAIALEFAQENGVEPNAGSQKVRRSFENAQLIGNQLYPVNWFVDIPGREVRSGDERVWTVHVEYAFGTLRDNGFV